MTPEQKQARIRAARKAARTRWNPDSLRRWLRWFQMIRAVDPASGAVMWTKLDDKWRDNPKVIEAGPYGELLWLHAIGYANEWDLPGRVPKKAISSLCRGFEHRGKQAYEDAVRAGLLVDGSDDFEIHDFFKYQWTKEQKEAWRVSHAVGGKARAADAQRQQGGQFAPAGGQPIDKGPAERPAIHQRHAGSPPANGPADRPASDQPVPVPISVSVDLQESADAHSLTRALHWLMHRNGNVIPDEPPREWLVDAELLFTKDQRDPREAVELLQWAMTDKSFWAGAITNMGTFRRKYDQIRLQRQRPHKTTAGERAAAFGQMAEQLREQKRLGEEQQ